MKKLVRMKLINWHRFTNCTIDFGDATLLSGENGAGKSTLLDAIQFVITCSANYFNKAAHDNGKRKLTGYIRCKTGRENKPYERIGEISAHIALEFYEEDKDRYFVVGAVIDSASEGQEAVARYLIDDIRFTEELFLNGKVPKSITEFRSSAKKIKQWCKTQAEAKKMMKARFGRIEEKFFRLIPKALAFKPIDDIKDFVYSYVLDEKEVNIDVLRENVRTYQDLQKTLDSVRTRLGKLEQIETLHDEVVKGLKQDSMYDFFLAQVGLDITKENIQNSRRYIQTEEYRLKEERQKLSAIAKEKEQKQEMETALRVEMKQDKDFLALEEEKRKLERLEEEEREQLEEEKALKISIRAAKDNLYSLQTLGQESPVLTEYQQMLEHLGQAGDLSQVRSLVEAAIAYKKEQFAKIQQEIARLQVRLNEKQAERSELKKKIENLSRKKLSYPRAVTCVQEAIQEEFARLGRDSQPHVLCELLEIVDEDWRNAVEGYLNTQRFYLLVEPENFDIALGTYDKLRKEGKAFGVGLINTQKMEEYDQTPAGTLASVVESKRRYAKRYINMILGNVQMCQRYDQLKKYKTAITKECMKYQNRVASAIKPSIFEVPFIGKNAFRIQLEQANRQYGLLEEAMQADQQQLENLEAATGFLTTDADVDIKYRLDVLVKLSVIKTKLENCRSNISTLEKNATLLQKQVQLTMLETIRKELEESMAEKNQAIGKLMEKIATEKQRIEQYTVSQADQGAKVAEIIAAAQDDYALWKKEYEKLTSQKSFTQFQINYDRRKKANETTTKEAERKMMDAMIQYKTEHDFGAPPTLDGFREFAAVYDRLKTSELLEYEEKVQRARLSAEEEFREQFLAKLQENMKQAQSEFKELNKALKDIAFSNEKYEFLFMPSRKFRSYYEMIMDDFNAMQGESLFSGTFHETHKEVIDELFEKLALDSENETRALDEFTDYRTYMDYDIKIIHTDGNYSFYSKVCEEKSGGETQTPFYVTVAASFVQLYSNNIGGEAIGLIMFDEAFNNMDDERIGGVLEFLHRLPLQLVIAAPPDKIQYIAPEMDQTLLVMTDERVSYVEGYHNEEVRQTYS
ncbi:AAA family ATPase [Anaerovorax odorimutans]|uniref:AAA family ATPase n=1 Tax=Anaerovorax odorimutans TaxID=109327 RepID=A0ABT1RLN4_9FIRM|nr:SbcC/MukB-like Walker B domain-containing protein [Anaerovorax odorimutans]MCQ4636099.1 AAA family ATPase [Anaerovorax odorimutans]